ncbi:uncharacterized protein LOC123523126 isoform X2 [Mercenaria mercenaria]|nr:uncharacterized protein LOC123523126 isoform X2 [Mercenaria mercenaria]XP_045156709.2 uncharacterized protein LOC123523126 isoform X2 [Mercenaria mercenaria]
METDSSQPSFNFPYQYGKSGKKRELFTDYGTTSFTDVDKDGEILSQRSKGDNHDRYSAVHPVLPLSSTAEEVKIPVKDRIMGPTIERNKKLKNFIVRLQKFKSLGKRWGKTDQVEKIFSAMQRYKAKFGDKSLSDCDVETFERITGVQIQPWFLDMLNEYTELQESAVPQFNNYMYTGGCIDTVPVSDTHCYITSAVGENFNKLRLTFVSKKADGLLQSFSAEEIDLPNTIYGVRHRQVQGQDFITARTDEQCYLYKFTPDSQDGKLCMLQGPVNQCFQSVDISPYIPGECVLVDENGQCCLWFGNSFDTISACGVPRFQVLDNWRHIQYGSHPRQVIYADQTAVQMFDLRTPETEGQDLFSLPSKLLHNRERIRVCDRHPASTFYHLVATDYNLMIMDERYLKYPVLRWEHMLSTPPQYITSVCGSGINSDDNFIYLASQYPADVHAFRFSARNGLPPLGVSQPHRAAKITDISKWPVFVDRCPNTDLLYKRLNTSLAGISTSPWQQGHVVFQLDSHGEIFHQVFSSSQSAEDITFSAGQGSHDMKPLPVAAERARSWVKSWGEMMKQQLSGKMKTREVQPALLGIYFYRNPHPACCVCRPDLSNIPGGIEISRETEYCETCLMQLQEGQNLVNSVQKDGVTASTSGIRPAKLKDVEDVPRDNALSLLLMKHWFGDEESSTVEDIMKIWDNEVIEKRSAKKRGKGRDLPGTSESSLMNRLLNKVSTPAASSPVHSNTSARSENWEPSTASSTDDLDEGQRSRKQKQTSENLQNDEKFSQKSSEKSQTYTKQRSKDTQREKKRRRKESSVNSEGISTCSEHVESIVLGSSDSAMSETFRERSNTGLPMFTSVLASLSKSRQQTTPIPTQSQKQTTPSQSKKLPKTSERTGSLTLFSSPESETSESTVFKIPTSSSKKKSSKRHKKQSPSESSLSIKTVSEISANAGSEDLFDDSSEGVLESDADRISPVLSVASCKGLLESQVSKNISRQLFSSQKSDGMAINGTASSSRKDIAGISPRKPSHRKHLAGF